MSDRNIVLLPVRGFGATTSARASATRFLCRSGAVKPIHLTLTSGIRLQIDPRSDSDARQIQRCLPEGELVMMVGDDSEARRFGTHAIHANLVLIRVNFRTGTLEIQTSFVGLPPVFLIRHSGSFGLTTPLMPSGDMGISRGDLDLRAAADLLGWGHPIDGRTLACNVRLLLPGTAIRIDAQGHLEEASARLFHVDPTMKSMSRPQLIEGLCEELTAAAGRTNCDDAVVSLSGGLDSRASSVALLAERDGMRFVTLAADNRSLEARLASAFCIRHGVDHQVVTLDHRFLDRLPQYVEEAARLTYGVAALNSTIDMFLYEQLGAGVARRMSGNLGNQVGRGGVESLSPFLPETAMLSRVLAAELGCRPCAPWFVERMNRIGFAAVLFQQEVTFSSVANYVVGSNYAIQQSLYASWRMIALASALFESDPELRTVSYELMRHRDLRHRLIGPAISTSFQRQFLLRTDHKAQDVPINWGWLANGNWSFGSRIRSVGTLLDAAAGKWGASRGIKGWIANAVPSALRDPFELVCWPDIVRTRLRELTNDVLRSEPVSTSGAFDAPALARVLDDHFSGKRDSHHSVVHALQIGLACMTLKQQPTTTADRSVCRAVTSL